MATYTELANYVKDWSNRDVGVLGYDTIRQCIRYAHDETYRTLRIAPLEVTREGTVTSAQVAQGYLQIEDDLVEFIQLRKRADEGPRSYSSFDKPYIVAEAHSDARSFNGDTVTLYSDYSFYREGTQIHIFPLIQEGEVWELYYYRRLPEVNERWDIDEVINLGLVDTTVDPNTITLENFNKYFELIDDTEFNILSPVDTTLARVTLGELGLSIVYPDGFSGDEYTDTDMFLGILKEHWLRDTNEKVLLFGALHQAFDYLDEADQSGKYKAKFEQEIQKLNKEDMDRMNSGGNINVNFYNRLI